MRSSLAGAAGKEIVVTLNAHDIESRTFAIEDRGYDRDEVRNFLLEVASSVRMALHSTVPPTGGRGPAVSAPPLTGGPDPSATGDDFDRLGTEVADILRAAHEAVDAMRKQAEAEANAIRVQAEQDARETRRKTEAEAAWNHDRAKRLLITAQEQADAIISESEAQARAMVDIARQQAEDHARQVAERARDHAEQVLRAEQETLRRLQAAQSDIATTIDVLKSADTRPVVDLTEGHPQLRFGELTFDVTDEQREMTDALVERDPLVHMVRAAVDRASAAAADGDGDGSADERENESAVEAEIEHATDGR